MLELFGENGANFSLQLSSRTQFAKIKTKKLSPKINVKKHFKNRVYMFRLHGDKNDVHALKRKKSSMLLQNLYSNNDPRLNLP